MAIATPESYADMLDRAKAGKYAIPAINVTSSQTLSAALKGFADAESDGIVQISNGGAAYWSGSSRLDRVKGSIAFTAYARAVGDLYPVTIGLHTDHCPKKLLADWIHPLLEIEAEQVKNGELPMFNSHMWDGSAEALDDNIEIAVDMLKRAKAANVVLEIEIGAVGGEEDGIKGEENANLYTTADDAWKAIEALGLGENGRYITALTFGNVHGSYKPGHVKLRPEILGEIQEDVAKRLGDRLSSKVGDKSSPFDLVMHGGSGSTDEEIATAVRNGVIKMNVDTDTQYAYTRPVAGWMYTNYEGVLKIDGEVGNKKQYDPRAWGKAAEKGISKADADAAYAPRALVEYTAEEARKAAAVAAEAKSKVLVIDPGFPVPGGIARGTLVVRPTKIMEMEHRQFAPVSAWPRFAGVTFEDDGLHVPGAIGFQPSLEQMLPSIGTWQINIYYTWKGNFDEPEEKTPVYNVRTWDEFGNGEVKQDEGQKIGELTLKPGDHVSTQLLVKPTTDPKATGLWAPRIQAPANGFVVHGVSVDYIENPD